MHSGRTQGSDLARRFVLIGLVIAAACGDAGSPTSPIDSDLDDDGIPNEIDACPDNPEVVNHVFDSDGCPDSPLDLYLAVRADAEFFWTAQFAGSGVAYSAVAGFTGYSVPIASGCGTLQLNNAFYCAAEGNVYYHTALLDQFLAQIGDAAPAVIIAHELGHHVSYLLGWFTARDNGLVSTKQLELQADCFAGAWLQSAGNRGLLEEGDLDEAVLALFAAGDPDWAWFNPNGHGTAQQRGSALLTGLLGGAGACDASVFPAAWSSN